MPALDLHQAEFLFHCDALEGTTLHVCEFSGHESLSRPFAFVIELVCDDPNVDLEAPIGQSARLTLTGRLFDGATYPRYVHGVIERFVQIGAGHRQSRYQATLVPALKRLAYTRNSQIFQKQSAPDVSIQVLRADKLGDDQISALLHSNHGVRDYCVQYQESDLDFVQRLWEEEGIFYFFEHQRDVGKLILGDGGHAFSSLDRYPEVRLRDHHHLHEECLTEFRAESALRPGSTVLRDFRFEQPTLDLEASADSDKFSDYKMYFFPGEYADPAMGRELAKLRLEELQCQKSRYVGSGSVRAMLPGYKFTLSGHRRTDCNQEYLITSAWHKGTQPQALATERASQNAPSYTNRIECIPAAVPFRPQRSTPRPSIAGVQTAVVVGPAGEEIHCDEHGRVKVKFHWDRKPGRDDTSSCWIRVSQPWGGAGQGGMFIPRVGQEVVVQFLEGDPDRPLIVGRVYNGENPVPHGLPASKNISTIRSASTPGGGGYNEIKFDDSKGKEELFVHAQFDLNEIVQHNHSTTVFANQSNHVHQDQSNTVDGKQTETIKKDQTLTVTEGNQDISVVKGHSRLTVKQDRTVTVQNGHHSVEVQTGNSSHTVNTGHHSVLVRTGDSSLTVNSGSHKTSVLTGSHVVHVATGGSGVIVDSGAHTTKCKQTLVLQSDGAGVELLGQGTIHGKSDSDVQLEAPEIVLSGAEITISAGQKITLIVGPSSITLDQSGVSISGPQVNSSAIGTHNISGALIKLN